MWALLEITFGLPKHVDTVTLPWQMVHRLWCICIKKPVAPDQTRLGQARMD